VTSIEQALASVSDCSVLAIDDNPTNTELIKRILVRAGLSTVIELHDSSYAREALAEHDPDLVLLDLRMPGVDGFEVLQMIRRESGAGYLPVIVVTADDSRSSIEQALELGAHDFLTKPFNATELVFRVRNLLMSRNAYKELRRSRAWLRTRLDLFEPDLAPGQANPEAIRTTIRQVIEDDGIRIALQPVVDMRDGSLEGAEALSRFPDDSLGNPAGWFAAALAVDMVSELELAAAGRAVALVPSRPAGTSVSINFSPATLIQCSDELARLEAPWDRIVIELTEHSPVVDYALLNAALAPLRRLGARVAVDDTGAGFASLRHILEVHPDVIKIDIGITRGVDADPSRAAMAGMLLSFAASMGLTVVAEGVETEGERDTLLELGAVLGQGYLFGRPEIVT
jgi:EAL domain-containing protein (putative c-di-GMP-specific phosphodiesterase class I)/DNA-binding NarL/FixJ family response regulator